VKIRSFSHKGLERLYVDSTKGVPPDTMDKLRKMLAFLDNMEDTDELYALAAWKAHTLTGDRRGTWSLSVTRNRVPALQQKALIFTESRRTQEYLYQILEKTEFAGKVVLFNGSNTDPKSKEIYKAWLERHAGTDRSRIRPPPTSAPPSSNTSKTKRTS
jgi:plasmid maintenance system killer protein